MVDPQIVGKGMPTAGLLAHTRAGRFFFSTVQLVNALEIEKTTSKVRRLRTA